MGSHGGLEEDGGALLVEPHGAQDGHHADPVVVHLAGGTGNGGGVQVGDAEQQLRRGGGCVLQAFPLAQCAEVVAEVWDARGLDAREDDLLGFLRVLRGALLAAVCPLDAGHGVDGIR